MEKDYEFKKPSEIVYDLLKLPLGTSIDFTFDAPEDAEMDNNFRPSEWYGAKIVEIDGFDGGKGGKDKCLIAGMWGLGILYISPDVNCYADCIYGFGAFCKYEGMKGEYLCVSKKYNGE